MVAVFSAIAILASILAPVIAFLVIALVSLRGPQPAERAVILRALAALAHRGDRGAHRCAG